MQPLKKGKSAEVNNISAELVQAGGEDVITALTTICMKIWQTREWPTPWTQSLVITLPKKGNLQQCQNYLISHVSKVMLKTILNRLKPQAEKIIAEEQAGFITQNGSKAVDLASTAITANGVFHCLKDNNSDHLILCLTSLSKLKRLCMQFARKMHPRISDAKLGNNRRVLNKQDLFCQQAF